MTGRGGPRTPDDLPGPREGGNPNTTTSAMLACVRIVTWNCCEGFASKYPLLRDLDFDVAVVAECGPFDPGLDQDRSLTHLIRLPVAGARKHLGVLAQAPWTVQALELEAAADMPWLLPVRVNGPVDFTLLAVWTQTQPSPYTAQTRRVAEEILPLVSGPVVLAGDLNAPGHDGSPTLARHLEVTDLLEAHGLVSAYAAARGLTPRTAHQDTSTGAASVALAEPTYYHHRRRDRPWHIDHVFVPREWHRDLTVQMGTYEEWVATRRSDHVPVLVDVL